MYCNPPRKKTSLGSFHQHKYSSSVPSCSGLAFFHLGPWLASFPPALGIFPVSPQWLDINTLLACSRLCLCQPLPHPHTCPPQFMQYHHSLHNQRTQQSSPTPAWVAVRTGPPGVRQIGLNSNWAVWITYFLCLYSCLGKNRDNDTAFMGIL